MATTIVVFVLLAPGTLKLLLTDNIMQLSPIEYTTKCPEISHNARAEAYHFTIGV